MKRSTAVSLVLMGSAALALSGCKPKAESYPSAEACVEAGNHTETECNEAFAAAQREHETAAPHFASREECTASYGPNGCEERRVEGGSGFFMPMMLGYMLGRGMGFHPLYQDRYRPNSFVAPGGASVAGYTYGQSGAGSETRTISRGGFGETGRSLSGGG